MPYIILAVVLIVVIWAIAGYNGLVRLRNHVEEAFSTMDVYLKKRYDLIPNLVETVKGYSKHESETLEKVIAARNQAVNAQGIEERIKSEGALYGALKNLFAVAEAYPDLKANQNFIDLQNSLKGVENDIANARKYYNGTVKAYNTKTELFPTSIIAGIFRFERKPLYEVNDASERENVRVQF